VLVCPERVWADPGENISPEMRKHTKSDGDVRLLAGRNKDGSGVIMIAAFMWMDLQFELEIAGMGAFDAAVFVTDKTRDQEPAAFTRAGNTLRIMKPSSSAVYSIFLTPKN